MERMAIVIVTGELVEAGLGVLADHGVRVRGSVALPLHLGQVGLIIAGEALPEACAEPGSLKVVTVELRTEAYGRQRMVRVSGISLTGKTHADVSDGLDLEVRRLRAAPGDTIVLKTERLLPSDVAARLKDQVLYALPDDHGCRVLVLDGGLDLEILGKGA